MVLESEYDGSSLPQWLASLRTLRALQAPICSGGQEPRMMLVHIHIGYDPRSIQMKTSEEFFNPIIFVPENLGDLQLIVRISLNRGEDLSSLVQEHF